jgi:Na+-translocating ferredoxin:NAD+ oxidoreductase RNF subunit RnfB
MAETHYHSLTFDTSRCTGCLICLRGCPTQAVRIREGGARLLVDRCIDCGACIRLCAEGAVRPLTSSLADLTQFEYTIAIPSPALYTQFEPGVSPGVIHEALRRCGFDDVASLSWSCGAITRAIEFVLAERRNGHPFVTGFCPTVVRLIQVNYPELIDHILPVIAPREVAAREAKRRVTQKTRLAADRIGAVYITPCSAKMVSIIDHPGLDRSYIDSVVSIRDLYHLLKPAIREVSDEGVGRREPETAAGMSWAFSTDLPSSLPAEDTLSVVGLPNVIRMLEDVKKGKLGRYALIEGHACHEGCVGGALTIENQYVARARAIRLRQTLGEDAPMDRADLLRRHQAGEFMLTRPIGAWPGAAPDHDLAGAIARMKQRERIRTYLPGIDCGACGAPTCDAFAEDVASEQAEEHSCIFVRQREIEHIVKNLARLVAVGNAVPRDQSDKNGAAREHN